MYIHMYCIRSIILTPMYHSHVLYVTPIADEQSNVMRTMEGNNVVAVGTFFGGLVAGGVCVVLVVGIVLGLVKLRKQRKGAESTEYEKKT